MATKKKMLQAAAGNATGGAGLNVEDVFSTYLYEGTGSALTITNGIDLDGEGGLTWLKMRDTSSSTARQYHFLYDTERGSGKRLSTNLTDAEAAFEAQELNSFNSNGFSLGSSARINETSKDYASWTFRKAPKFFDVVTWSGDNANSRAISHNLGCEVGAIFIKNITTAENWVVYNRGAGLSSSIPKTLKLNLTDAAEADNGIMGSAPTSTQFYVSNAQQTNAGGKTYVAYLFAHNDGDGEFGPDGDADIIKCGSYTGNASDDGPEIDLGFEPQWVLVKCATTGGSSPAYEWYLMDTMRGMTGESDTWITVNSSVAESSATYTYVKPEPNGFKIQSPQSRVNASGETYIYIAIRRGTKVPESGTEVFALQQDDAGDGNAPAFRSDFPVDFAIERRVNSSTLNNFIVPRLTAPLYVETNTTAVENSNAEFVFDYNNGWNSTAAQNANNIAYMWKRAPQFCDVVGYTGNGTAGRTVSHNLGVAPEMMWIKRRDNLQAWAVYHTGTDATAPEDYNLRLDTDASSSSSDHFNDTAPTSSNFTLGSSVIVNALNAQYIAYLFSTLDGISKVGSYTGDGTDGRAIDCSFTAGARFVLIKRTNLTGSWNLWDSVRGIISGNDPYIELDSTDAEVTTADYIDPHASGFVVNNNVRTNRSGDEYVFYAIA